MADDRVSAQDIQQIVGPLDDAVVAAIIATGASVGDVREAFAWLTTNDSLAQELKHPCQGRAAIVCDILAPEIEPAEEPTRPT
jgi:hypothetical protein